MQVVSRGTVMRAWSSGLFHVEHFWFPPEPVRRGGVPPLFRKDCSTWNTLKVTRVDRQGNTRFRPARLPDRLCREQCRSLEARCLAIIRQFLIAVGSAVPGRNIYPASQFVQWRHGKTSRRKRSYGPSMCGVSLVNNATLLAPSRVSSYPRGEAVAANEVRRSASATPNGGFRESRGGRERQSKE